MDCPNVLGDGDNSDRIIEVEWAVEPAQERKEFQVDIEISAFDRQGVLNEVMMVVAETKTPIVAVSGKADRESIAKNEINSKNYKYSTFA